MATTTRERLRQLLAETMGRFFLGSRTSGGSSTTIVDSKIQRFDAGGLRNLWILITSGALDGELSRISSISGSTITVSPTFTRTPPPGTTYEIHQYDPTDAHAVLSAAGRALYPDIYLPLRNEDLIVDNLLSNPSMENVTGTDIDNWSESSSGTMTIETSRVVHGSRSALLVGSGASKYLTQSIPTNTKELVGATITCRAWVWTTSASGGRLNINWGGAATTTNGSYHTGDGSWQQLTVSGTIPVDATSITMELEAAAGASVYFDVAWGHTGKAVHRYTIPTEFIQGPHFVSVQQNSGMPEGLYRRFGEDEAPKRGRILRLEGMGIISAPTTDAGTIEIAEPRLRVLVDKAAAIYSRRLARMFPDRRAELIADAAEWEQVSAAALTRPGIKMQPMASWRSLGVYHTDEDADGRYLVFDVVREQDPRRMFP